MEERDVDRNVIEESLNSPKADFHIDAKSGNYVFRIKDCRVVVRKSSDQSFIVVSVFKIDQSPV